MEAVINPVLERREFVAPQYPKVKILEHWQRHQSYHYDLDSQGAPLFEKVHDSNPNPKHNPIRM